MNDAEPSRGKAIALLSGCVLAIGTFMTALNATGEEQSPVSLREMLVAGDRRVQSRAIAMALEDRRRLVTMLTGIVDQANEGVSSREAGKAAACLLGKLRAPEAVPSLSRALATLDPNDFISSDIDPLTAAFFDALVEIGRPSVPAMIQNVMTSDERMLRILSLDVMKIVLGGKDNLTGVLSRLMEEEGRSDEERARLASAIEWARLHYKDATEPLFQRSRLGNELSFLQGYGFALGQVRERCRRISVCENILAPLDSRLKQRHCHPGAGQGPGATRCFLDSGLRRNDNAVLPFYGRL